MTSKAVRAKSRNKAKRAVASTRLQAQRELFVAAYMIHRNAGEAAIAAGFKSTAARQQGYRILHQPETQAMLAKAQAEAMERLKMTADEVIVGMSRVARLDVRRLFGPDGQMLPIHQLDDDTALALAGIEVETRHQQGDEDEPPIAVTVKKIKANDRMKAFELLGRVHGIFEKDNKQSQPVLYDVNFGG